jgi:hypothetical protein
MPFQLIYTSEATNVMSIETLKDILEKARANNQTKGITGALTYVDGVFLQILEGDQTDVKLLAERISHDNRHTAFKIIYEHDIIERLFGSWDMACIRPSAKEMASWARIDGATTARDIVNALQKEAGRVPDVVINIVKNVTTLPGFL